MAKTKGKLGGARQGAGRKPILKRAVLRSVTFEKADMDALARIARQRGWTFAEAVRRAVATYLKSRSARG